MNKVYKGSTSIKPNTDTLVKDPFKQYIVTYFAQFRTQIVFNVNCTKLVVTS